MFSTRSEQSIINEALIRINTDELKYETKEFLMLHIMYTIAASEKKDELVNYFTSKLKKDGQLLLPDLHYKNACNPETYDTLSKQPWIKKYSSSQLEITMKDALEKDRERQIEDQDWMIRLMKN